jgi:aconitase A
VSAPTTVSSAPASLDSFNCKRTLTVDGKDYVYYSLPEAEKNGLKGISKLPYSMRLTSSPSPNGSTTRAKPRKRLASAPRAF